MNKRNVAIALWFAMGWVLGSALAILIDAPTIFGGALVAFAAAAFIRSAGRRLWPAEAQRSSPTPQLVTRSPLATE